MVRAQEAEEKGAQIDLIIDRNDQCITLCEIKHSVSEYVITKSYAQKLRHKRDLFRQVSGTKKTLWFVMITTNGVKRNDYYHELIAEDLTLDALYG